MNCRCSLAPTLRGIIWDSEVLLASAVGSCKEQSCNFVNCCITIVIQCGYQQALMLCVVCGVQGRIICSIGGLFQCHNNTQCSGLVCVCVIPISLNTCDCEDVCVLAGCQLAACEVCRLVLIRLLTVWPWCLSQDEISRLSDSSLSQLIDRGVDQICCC